MRKEIKKRTEVVEFPTMFGLVSVIKDSWTEECPECGSGEMEVKDISISTRNGTKRSKSCSQCGFNSRDETYNTLGSGAE